jgi:hypothetical protein
LAGCLFFDDLPAGDVDDERFGLFRNNTPVADKPDYKLQLTAL